jgi:hypothetical protein
MTKPEVKQELIIEQARNRVLTEQERQQDVRLLWHFVGTTEAIALPTMTLLIGSHVAPNGSVQLGYMQVSQLKQIGVALRRLLNKLEGSSDGK